MRQSGLPPSRKLSVVALFSIAVFISKTFLPSPIDKMAIAIQALLYALATLLVGKFGATFTGVVSGLMIQAWRPAYAPFTFLFAVIYGLLIDSLIRAFKARSTQGTVNPIRMMSALLVASAITGFSAMYVTVSIGMMPEAYHIYLVVLLAGALNGLLAGYLASQIWNRYLYRK